VNEIKIIFREEMYTNMTQRGNSPEDSYIREIMSCKFLRRFSDHQIDIIANIQK